MLTAEPRTCKRVLCLLPVALLPLLGACSSVETQSFRSSTNPAIESAQVATDAEFSQYDSLHAEEMGIFFPASAATSADDLQRIRALFRDAFLGKLGDYTIVAEPAPAAMTVQATLIDFRRASRDDVMGVRADMRDMASPGSIVFLMELRDSMTGRVLARAADSAAAPAIADEDGETTDWGSVEAAADRWATLFREFLDQNLGT